MVALRKNIIIYWFRMEAAKAARTILVQHYNKEECKAIIQGYWKRYLNFKPDVPKMPTLGGNITVNLAAMSRAFYEELTDRGQNEAITTQLFYEIAWKIYVKMGRFSWWLSKWGNRSDYNRLSKATQLFRAFPFNSPSYQWEDVHVSSGVVGFNCKKCPVAEYFQKHDLSTFCTKTWCALDYPLAELWHSKLERTGSIAGGADICDFRWVVIPEEKSDKN